jgi:hypothetical protein
MIKQFAFFFILISATGILNAQENWNLERDRQGIKIFTRKSSKNSMKDSRAELIVKGTPDQIINEFRNTANHKNWMHRISTSELIKKINNSEFYAYYVASAPWPVSDRDAIVHYIIKKEPNGNYTIYANGNPNMIPLKDGKVRIPKLDSIWEIVAQSNGTTKIIYTTSTEPGGNVPTWLTNSSATDAPFETVSRLKAIVEK